MDGLVVRERLGPCPVLGDAEVKVVEELRERDDLGDGRHLGVGSIRFWNSISKT